ncbi:MAG: hypothetical protein ACJAUD_002388 [Crocinitomicaceae bacterium]|jgi:hypothetical protein
MGLCSQEYKDDFGNGMFIKNSIAFGFGIGPSKK